MSNNKTIYKDSLLGKIPRDWDVKELKDVVVFLDRKRKPIRDSDRSKINGIYPYYGASGIIDYVNDFIFDEELILLGEDGANIINRSSPLAFRVSGKIWVNNHAHILKPNKNIEAGYLTEFLESLRYDRFNTGTAQPKLNKEVCSSIPIILPPLPEQKAIAHILGLMNKAINKNNQLIAKKELQKKWLMQNLLTGKKRLKGFSGEANKLGAGDIFKSVSVKGFDNEKLLSATQDRGIIPRSMLEGRVTMPTNGTESYKLVEPGDFVVSLRSFQGGLEYSYYKGIVSPAYTILKPKKKIDDEFYKQYFKSNDFIGHLSIAVIGIRDGKQISYDDFCTVRIPYPSPEEQIAIAQVLQAADKELQLLKSKTEKLREQKRGLMQVLLTGKKRLTII